jgi:endoribonuclease Dicer
VIKTFTDFEVEHYHGAKGVDNWEAVNWQEELTKYQASVIYFSRLIDSSLIRKEMFFPN